MLTNLTEYQLEVAGWLAQQHDSGLLYETFSVKWVSDQQEKMAKIENYKGKQIRITFGALETLEREELLLTISKDIYNPPKPQNTRGAKATYPVYVFPVKKREIGRTYILRNEIFRARDLYEKRQLVKDAERILEFMINRPAGMQFATRPELMSTLELNDERYEQVCQFLEDFELIQYRASIGMLWGDIRPTKVGRQVMHEKSLENLLLTQSPIVNYHHLGDQINVTNSGANASIAAGRQSNVTRGLTGSEVESLFEAVFQKLEQSNLPNNQKQEIKETIELIEGEVEKETGADEKALRHYFRTLARMAPDMLDVVIATATNPLLGAGTIIRRVAEKAKADAQSK